MDGADVFGPRPVVEEAEQAAPHVGIRLIGPAAGYLVVAAGVAPDPEPHPRERDPGGWGEGKPQRHRLGAAAGDDPPALRDTEEAAPDPYRLELEV